MDTSTPTLTLANPSADPIPRSHYVCAPDSMGDLSDDDDSVLGSVHCVDVGGVTDVSELHAASIFRGELSVVCECLCRYRVSVQQLHRRRMGGWCLVDAHSDSRQRKLSIGYFKNHGVHKAISNWCSHVVTHPSSHQTQCCLTTFL
jgi:hypothetical protein